ncbi:hypothetical protein HDU93_006449, partial [Gonapodya sp. JEL0774]
MGRSKNARAVNPKKGGAWETLKTVGVAPKEVPPPVSKKEVLAKIATKSSLKREGTVKLSEGVKF